MPEENLEVIVARLDERFKSMQDIIMQMASDQRTLTESYQELVKNSQRLVLIEKSIEIVQKDVERLDRRLTSSEKDIIDNNKEDSKTFRGYIFEGVRLVVVILITLILAKLGIPFHLL